MNKELHKRIRLILNNDILKGFKNTKIGIIPEDWEVLRLKDKFDRLSRKNAEGNTNVLTISAQYGLINQEEFFKKEIASDDKSNYYLLHRGEFAYNKSYSNGYPFGAIKRLSRYDKGVVSPLYICFSANSNNACPEYCEQYFEAGRLNHEIQAYAQEGARNHGLLNISVIDFFNSFILVPPIAEQRRIAKILSAQDKVIECYEKKIEQLKLMKKYYLQNMFPKRGETVPKIRFKGFTDPWKQRELGECMETVTDYVAAGSFADIADHVQYKNSPDFAQLIRTADLKHEFRNIDYVYVDKDAFDYLWRVNLNEECIVLPNIGANIGEVYYIEPLSLPYKSNVLGPNAILLKTKDSTKFMFTLLQADDFQNKLYISIASSGQPKFNKTELKSIKILMPRPDEQEQIGAYFSKLDHLITLHQRKLEEEKKKKKALQQLLLTGIVRTN